MTSRFKNTIPALVIFAVLLAVGLACGGAKDAKPVPSEYHGAWRGSDGATLTIRSDGSADYRSGGTSVTGGKAELSDGDKTLSITLFGMGPSFKIDKPPAGDQMTLEGVVYKKS